MAKQGGKKPNSVLVLAGAQHQVLDGLAWVFAVFENQLHLLRNGHLDAMLAGQTESGACSVDAFRNLAAQRSQYLSQLAAFAEFIAYRPVAAERSRAGEHEVATTGKPGERFAAAAAGDGEASDLGDAASDKRGGGVVAEANADSDAGSDGDHVLERASELDTNDVG